MQVIVKTLSVNIELSEESASVKQKWMVKKAFKPFSRK